MNDWNQDQQNDPWASPQAPSQHPHHHSPYQQPKSSNGIVVIILAVIAWFGCGIFTAIPGFLIARGDRQRMKSGVIPHDTAIEVGYWLNLIIIGLTGLGFVAFFFLMLLSAAV